MKRGCLMRSILVTALLLVTLNLPAMAEDGGDPKDWSNNEYFLFIEKAVSDTASNMHEGAAKAVGGSAMAPLTDVYAGLSAAASASKPAFLMWLDGKIMDANDANNLDQMDRYQAFRDALATGNNQRLLSIQKDHQKALDKQNNTSRPGESLPVDPATQPLGSGGAKDDDINWGDFGTKRQNAHSQTRPSGTPNVPTYGRATTGAASTQFSDELRKGGYGSQSQPIDLKREAQLWMNELKPATPSRKYNTGSRGYNTQRPTTYRRPVTSQPSQGRNPFMPDLREAGSILGGARNISRP